MPARGSSQFGPDIIVGSAEYQKKMREKNPKTHKLAQAKYRLKQKQLALAAKIAVADGIPVEQALEEVVAKTDATVKLQQNLVVEGRITHHTAPPVQLDEDPEFPPVAEMVREAEETGQTYAQVKEAYRQAAKWNKPVEVDDDFMRLVAAKGLAPLSVGDMAKGETSGPNQEDGSVAAVEGDTTGGK